MAYNPASSAGAARAFHMANAASATPNNVYKVTTDDQPNRLTNVNFPVQLGSSDPEDVKYALRAQLVKGNNGMVDGVGQAIAGEEYFDYITRKQHDTEYVMFQDWMMKQADWSTPEATEYWVSRFPWMLEKRLSEVSRVSDLQNKMAKVNIAGPQTEDDFRLLWNIQRGLIDIPTKAPHLLAEDEYTKNNNYYERGMFSPMVNYVPPFKTDADYKNPGYKPNDKVRWADPSNRGDRLTGTSLTIPGWGRTPQSKFYGAGAIQR